jgi:hypothetical protein
VTPHILRHTCATWLMQGGVNLWDAAGFLGMTVQQLEATYGHHHPDYQQEAITALRGQDLVFLVMACPSGVRATLHLRPSRSPRRQSRRRHSRNLRLLMIIGSRG